jgi:hypothetical protein
MRGVGAESGRRIKGRTSMTCRTTRRALDALQAELDKPRAFRTTTLTLDSLASAAAAACNGHEEYCSRTYSNVSVIGAHNSYGVSAGSSEWPDLDFARRVTPH